MYWLSPASLVWQQLAPRAPALRTTGLCSSSESERQMHFSPVSSRTSGWRPRRPARIGPSHSFSDQIGCSPLTVCSTSSSISATMGPTSKRTGNASPWHIRANPTRLRVLSLRQNEYPLRQMTSPETGFMLSQVPSGTRACWLFLPGRLAWRPR